MACSISPAFSDGLIQNYINQAAFAETAFTTSSQGADVSGGGIRVNMIPRDGGNEFHGSLYAGVTDGSWQSSNLNDDLRAEGRQLGDGHHEHLRRESGGRAARSFRDRLWFFAAMRWMSVDEKVVNAYFPDGSPAIVDQYVNIPLARLTYQATSKVKISAFYDRPFKYKGREFMFGIEPISASRRRNWGEANYHNLGTKLTATLSSRFLYELGFTQIVERLHSGYQPQDFQGNAQFGGTTVGWPRPSNRDALLRDTVRLRSELRGDTERSVVPGRLPSRHPDERAHGGRDRLRRNASRSQPFHDGAVVRHRLAHLEGRLPGLHGPGPK